MPSKDKLTIREILEAVQGQLLAGEETLRVNRISIDSRTLRRGALFLAIKGQNYDGHDFIRRAVRQGARAVIVSRTIKIKDFPGTTVIKVPNTVTALGQIARLYRRKFRIPVIAITGSAGKTTTKNLLAAILKTRKRVLVNQGSFNNHIGVPLTLLKLKAAHQIAVLELGTNQPGDIRWLTAVCEPDVALYTNIGESHLQRLKSPRQVFKEKSQLIKGLPAKGRIIINNDDNYLKKLHEQANNDKIISYAIRSPADYRANAIEKVKKGQGVRFKVNRRNAVSLHTPVLANVYNCLGAISCARLWGISYKDIRKALNTYRFTKQRQSVEHIGRLWLIDDSYNANPVSMRSAVTTLHDFPAGGRKILICGDMLELGGQSKALHQKMGDFIARHDIDFVFAFGPMSFYLAERIRKKNKATFIAHFLSLSALHRQLIRRIRKDDVLLIKASRGMHLESTAEFVRNHSS